MSQQNRDSERLNGRTVLVTGAGNQVGAAVAKRLAAAGSEVFVADVSGAAAATTAAAVAHGNVHALQLAVTSEADWRAAMQKCTNAGGLHLLVNADQQFAAAPITDTLPSVFDAQLTRNALGCWLGQKYAIETMAAGDGGVIVNVTSVLALAAAADCAAYCAAARGVLMSTKSAALECARDGLDIVVNAVLVGAIEDDKDHFPNSETLGGSSCVTPEEVADAVVFLATDGSDYMTGTELPVDGGWLAR
jgi:NAD(P)-dependent dehydrogenase (short-subunit alcohol dehydrogenase family)